jgi:hypothetical protein
MSNGHPFDTKSNLSGADVNYELVLKIYHSDLNLLKRDLYYLLQTSIKKKYIEIRVEVY